VAELGRVPELTIELSEQSRRTLARVLCAAVLGVGCCAFLAVAAVRHGYFDLKVYYGAVNFWINDGGQIYDYLLPKTEYGFTYPPFAAVLMSPMAFVGWKTAIAISVVLSVSSLFAVIYWLVGPLAARRGWPRWFAFVISFELAAVLEPIRETVNFGQVNLILMVLVAADVLLLVRRDHRMAGIGIGIATAVKLTPGVFIIYLLITRRWRAAGTAAATVGTATWLAATVAPDASRVFWTDAIWNTDRVGRTDFVSNQSLNGIVARLNPIAPSTSLWAALVLAAFAIWMVRVRRAVDRGDEPAALTLTGIFSCLVSPITWVHHLVWALPAVIILVGHGLDRTRPRYWRNVLLVAAVLSYGVLSSRVVWQFEYEYTGLGYIGSNMYALLFCVFLVGLPLRRATQPGSAARGADRPPVEDVPDLVDLDRRVTAAFDATDAARTVDAMAQPLAKAGVP
jgi:alpha-1,2-mannosyltransferase